MDRAAEIAAFLAETAGQDPDAVLCGIISRWPDATGAEIEQALATFALVRHLGERHGNSVGLVSDGG